MTTAEDNDLLQQFKRERSEAAFSELVTRHIDLVYSIALRVVNGDAHLAQDVTQTVFIDLARKARRLPRDVVLAGWLHRHTCYKAATAIRTERRRRAREQIATEMRALDENPEPRWELIAPYLDEALNQLSPSDRDAIVLRFLKQQDFRAVGAALGISEDAAEKRVSRALEKLRGVLSRRGVALTAVALTSLLATEAVTAPAGLAVGVAAAALAESAAPGTTLTFLKLLAATKFKLGIIGALVVAGLAMPLLIQHEAQAALHDQEATLRRQADQIAEWQGKNERLLHLLSIRKNVQTPLDDQFRQILRLRDEIGRLQADVQKLTKSKADGPLSRKDVLAAMRQLYANRVKQLKQLFETNPSEAVPELQYLTDRHWIEVVEFDFARDPTNDSTRTMSMLRSGAQIDFAMTTLSDALMQYGKNNNDQFPTAISQLTPYFKAPVDDSVLRDWVILAASSLPSEMRVDEDWVITQKAPVNADWDQRVVVGLKHAHLGSGGRSQWGPP